jgi:adenine phosphoribosyltransferase
MTWSTAGALAVQEGAVAPGSALVVVDDVLATGGTAAAACALLELVGAEIVGLDVVMELAALGGRSALVGREVYSLTVA